MNKHEMVRKASENAETFVPLDPYFWSLILSYIGDEPNVKGAIDGQFWSVALITMKELLRDAVLIHLYLRGWRTYDRSLYYMYKRLEESLRNDKELFREIIDIELSSYDDKELIFSRACRAIEIAYKLVPRQYIELFYKDNCLDFDKYLETIVRIDEIDQKRKPYVKFALDPEINKSMLKISRLIDNKSNDIT